MAFLRILVISIIAANVARSQEQQTLSAGSLFGSILDRLRVSLIDIPNDLFGFWYNTAAAMGSGILNSRPCKVQANEDADACRNVSEMIRSRGFEAEEHDITTKDGYIITIQRVINPLVAKEYRARKRPVILQPGVSITGADYIINSVYVRPAPWPKEEQAQMSDSELSDAAKDQRHPRSLAFYLSNRGYDVFLANHRGTVYGQRHVNKSVVDPDFWNFSFDEQIDHDVPETIALVRRLTGHSKIAFVGWSQGAASMFGLQADHPEYADIIEPFIALGPTPYLGKVDTVASRYLYPFFLPFNHANMGLYFSDLSRYLLRQLCAPTSIQRQLCAQLVLFPTFGPDRKGFEVDRIPTYMHHTPSGASMKNVVQYPQQHYANKFRRLDLGPAGNRLKYGRDDPPEYDVSRIRSESIVLFTADTDYLANPRDINTLVTKLQVKPYRWFNITEDEPHEFSHISFVYSKKAGTLINERVFGVLEEFGLQQ